MPQWMALYCNEFHCKGLKAAKHHKPLRNQELSGDPLGCESKAMGISLHNLAYFPSTIRLFSYYKKKK